jgi:catechol 2,3-dioxygenase-like lactoylglutathione lyase family enzyme
MTATTRAELRHVSIESTDIVRAEAFYDVFLGRIGFRRFVREPTYVGYTDGTLTFWVLHGARVHRDPPTGDEEVIADHLAFWLPSAKEVEAVQADLEHAEIYPTVRAAERPEFRPGYVSAIWVDPDGEVLELYSTGTRAARKQGPKAKHRRPTAKRSRSRRR